MHLFINKTQLLTYCYMLTKDLMHIVSTTNQLQSYI